MFLEHVNVINGKIYDEIRHFITTARSTTPSQHLEKNTLLIKKNRATFLIGALWQQENDWVCWQACKPMMFYRRPRKTLFKSACDAAKYFSKKWNGSNCFTFKFCNLKGQRLQIFFSPIKKKNKIIGGAIFAPVFSTKSISAGLHA